MWEEMETDLQPCKVGGENPDRGGGGPEYIGSSDSRGAKVLRRTPPPLDPHGIYSTLTN